MNEAKLAAAKARMAELAVKFLDRSDADINSMRAGLGRLASGDAAALGEIRHLAHRMVGTGATLGFESLSGAAHRIEQIAENCTGGPPPDETVRTQIASALDSLSEECRKQRRAGS